VELEFNEGLDATIPSLMKSIAAVLPPKDEFGNDERVLTGGNKMNFSVSDMYTKEALRL
jgi:hypothetical protein